MTKKIDQLFSALDLQLCQKQFDDLNRTQPVIIEIIGTMVDNDVRPKEIKSHVIRQYPNMWILGQALEQAAVYARHLKESG